MALNPVKLPEKGGRDNGFLLHLEGRMPSTAAKRIAASMLLAVACGWAGASFAAKSESGVGVVARLYKDFAWEAMASQPEFFGEGLAHQDKATLRRYFTPALAELLERDAACQVKAQGICNLDFSLLFYSQDPRVTDLDIQPRSLDRVEVAFKDPVTGERTKIAFRLTRVDGLWRVADILYGQQDTSLKNVLSRRMSR